jgi:hypothetical protein
MVGLQFYAGSCANEFVFHSKIVDGINLLVRITCVLVQRESVLCLLV